MIAIVRGSCNVACTKKNIQMIVERQVMAENKPEFVFASCQLVNVWAQKMTADERIMFVTEVYTQNWF